MRIQVFRPPGANRWRVRLCLLLGSFLSRLNHQAGDLGMAVALSAGMTYRTFHYPTSAEMAVGTLLGLTFATLAVLAVVTG